MKSKFLLVYVFALVAVIGIAALGTAVSSFGSVSVAAASEKQSFEKQFKVAEVPAQTSKLFGIGKTEFSTVNPQSFTNSNTFESAKFYPCSATENSTTKNFDLQRLPDIYTKTKFGDNFRERFIFARTKKTFDFGFRNRQFVQLE
ncbi:MAG TPA: hypothetical protein PKY59_12620 [Pyrinomonadaceae bacterium]|nr:hypothetical protein [Pyrinomonadaceae bacterium]